MWVVEESPSSNKYNTDEIDFCTVVTFLLEALIPIYLDHSYKQFLCNVRFYASNQSQDSEKSNLLRNINLSL